MTGLWGQRFNCLTFKHSIAVLQCEIRYTGLCNCISNTEKNYCKQIFYGKNIDQLHLKPFSCLLRTGKQLVSSSILLPDSGTNPQVCYKRSPMRCSLKVVLNNCHDTSPHDDSNTVTTVTDVFCVNTIVPDTHLRCLLTSSF